MKQVTTDFQIKTKRARIALLVLALSVPLFFLLDIFTGSVAVPFSEVFNILLGGESEKEAWSYIVIETRLPQAITAMVAGAALASGGLLLQGYFRNPLAGPDVLGISSGSMLGVAVLFMGGTFFGIENMISVSEYLRPFAAFAGAVVVMMLIMALSRISRDGVSVIIGGLMMAYISGALVDLLQHAASRDGLQRFVFWGFGTFGGLDLSASLWFALAVILVLIAMLFFTRSMNVWVLGESYAQSMGISLRTMRISIIFISGLLTALVTAYCGPIAFIGIAVPHLVRWTMRTEDHLLLFPGVMLLGASLSLLCSLITRLPVFEEPLPLNSVTSLLGAPVVLYVVFRQSRKGVRS